MSAVEREALRNVENDAVDVVPVSAVRPVVEQWIAMFASAEDAFQALATSSRFTASLVRARRPG